MAISTAAAIIGSSLIGGAAAMNSASQQRRAASQGLAAQTEANDKALAEQRAAREMTYGVNQRFLGGGGDAFDLLLQEFGVRSAPGPGQPTTTQQPTTGGQSGQWDAYLAANPDVAGSAWLQGVNTGDLTGDGTVDQRDRAAYHYQHHGQAEGRQLPAAQPVQQSTGKPEGGNAGTSPLEAGQGANLLTAARPEAPPAPTFERSPDIPVPTFQRGPDMAPPPAFSFDPASLREDQGYKFLLDEMSNNVNARFGAKGNLRSGAALKGFTRETAGVADQYLGNVFNRALAGYGAQTDAYRYGQNRQDNLFADDRSTGLNLWQTQQGRQDRNDETGYGLNTDAYRYGVNRGDQNFNTDRGFQRSERDTRTGNLFSLAGMGMQAAGNVSGAATNYANNAGNIFGSQANAAADAAAQRAQANAYMGGAIGNMAGNIFALGSMGQQPNAICGASGSAFNSTYRGYGPSGF